MNEDVYLFLVAVIGAFLAGAVLAGTIVWFVRRGAGASRSQPRPPSAPGNEVLRIAADPAGGHLQLYVNGSPVRQVESIADRKLRLLLRSLMDLLESPAEPAEPSPAQPTPAPLAQTPRAPVVPAVPSAASQWAKPAASAPMESAAPPPTNQWAKPAAPAPAESANPVVGAGALPTADLSNLPLMPDEELRGSFFDRLKSSLTPVNVPASPIVNPVVPAVKRGSRAEPAAPEQPSMFEQIDGILQKKLRAYPNAPDMLIYEDGGELRIRVGNEVAHSIDEVRDEAARSLIRDSVSEWEAR